MDALFESVGSGRSPALNLRVTVSRSGGLNRPVGFSADFRLGLMGNYLNCGGLNRILVSRE